MIVSVSRRTDIPSFYSEWFINRIREKKVYVKNPFNRKQISEINLSPDYVTCFVFWTKDPKPLMRYLSELKDYTYYFQITLTSYQSDMEPCVRKKNDILETIIELSKKIGSKKVIWRYDPILLNEKYTKEYHYEWFEKMASKLSGYVDKCVISFIDIYKETKRNAAALNIKELSFEEMIEVSKKLSEIAKKYNIIIESCSEKIDLDKYGIKHTSCIDGNLVAELTGQDPKVFKKDNLREACGCFKCVDIGEYNSCLHKCAYCYANFNQSTIETNYDKNDVNSPLMTGELQGDEKITQHYLSKPKKKVKVVERAEQQRLF